MALTLKNYVKELPKELLLLAEKNAVRECDETEPGHFVAYVDEGNDSFDVALIILPNGTIGKSACDCKDKLVFCRHKAALLLHIAKGKKAKETIKLKKKENNAESLLDQVDFNALKDWVKNLIQKNSDIELAFNHHFSEKKREYTIADVTKMMKGAIKVIAGNKKAIDATQLKKLVELWAEVLQPVVQYYHEAVMNETAFLCFHTLLEECIRFQSGINNNSNKIPKYVEGILQSSEASLINLQNDQAWNKAVGFFIAHIPDGANYIRMHYLQHLKNVISACSIDKRTHVIGLLTNQFKLRKTDELFNGPAYAKTVFEIVETYELFPQYHEIFKPLRFENAFNEKLIDLLIENHHLDIAKMYCEEQIKYNYRDEYNISYLARLKEIYTIQKDEEQLADVLAKLFPYSFNFDDYLFIINRLDADERKKWRTKVLSRARNTACSHRAALVFPFRLVDYEGNYKKMIDYIDSNTPYDIILKYFEQMMSADKLKLLLAILKKSEDAWSVSAQDLAIEEVCFPELFNLAEKHYTTEYLKMAVLSNAKTTYYYRPNRFLIYLKEHLGMK